MSELVEWQVKAAVLEQRCAELECKVRDLEAQVMACEQRYNRVAVELIGLTRRMVAP